MVLDAKSIVMNAAGTVLGLVAAYCLSGMAVVGFVSVFGHTVGFYPIYFTGLPVALFGGGFVAGILRKTEAHPSHIEALLASPGPYALVFYAFLAVTTNHTPDLPFAVWLRSDPLLTVGVLGLLIVLTSWAGALLGMHSRGQTVPRLLRLRSSGPLPPRRFRE